MKPGSDERDAVGDLPQYYSDMFGWEAMVTQVAAVYERLTPAERQHTVISVGNCGEAGALDFFGRRYGLPKATCAHNNYGYWRSGDPAMRVAIVFGARRTLDENLADLKGPGRFDEATLAATTQLRALPTARERADDPHLSRSAFHVQGDVASRATLHLTEGQRRRWISLNARDVILGVSTKYSADPAG